MFEKIDDSITKFLEFIMILCLSLTVIVTFLQVLFRYFIQISIPWSQEFLMICFVYSVFSGAAVLVSKNEHLVVDLFEKLPKKYDVLFRVIECLVALFVLSILVIYGSILVNQNLVSGQTLGLLPIQRAYLYMAVPLSSLFMIYFYVRRLYKVCFGYS
ncbi:TRAP transporter small permease [Jeotgalicoccus huakuii]|uniref:TRAP transporter small permease n=1 Tax=Jeotgalicoccus TaxID=227979 RepID=UPI0006878F0C|nr:MULTISPECIES: TRAP transporter small permease [Jeotgalicoccus]MCK1976969.1 TRAP transporter small permease [Jeotgalicoccus huakuii]QQD84614.1 TRAP transporter small permease [Jeotgalicoccus sp. ATCC 8456]